MIQSLVLIHLAISRFMNMQIYEHVISHVIRIDIPGPTYSILPTKSYCVHEYYSQLINYLIKIQLTTTLCKELNRSHPLTSILHHSLNHATPHTSHSQCTYTRLDYTSLCVVLITYTYIYVYTTLLHCTL